MWKIIFADLKYHKIFIFISLFALVTILSYLLEIPILSVYLRKDQIQSMLLGAIFSFTFLIPPIKFLIQENKMLRINLLPISKLQKILLFLFAFLFGPIFTSVCLFILSFFTEISLEKFLIFIEVL